jgi:hypothetical protein
MLGYPHRKYIEKNKEVQSLINLILKNKIKNKDCCKKKTNDNPG